MNILVTGGGQQVEFEAEKDGFVYMIRYNNDGTVKEEIEVGVATPEEGGENN